MVWATKKGQVLIVAAALLVLAAAGSISSRVIVSPSYVERVPGESAPHEGGPKSHGGVAGSEPRPEGTKDVQSQQKTASVNDAEKLDKTLSGSPDAAATVSIADLPPLQNRVIKTGSMTLRTKKGRFNEVFDQVILLARAGGGYVAASTGAASDNRLVSGTVTIRVPAKNFESVVAKLRQLGRLTQINIDSQDVSTEFVDLESRLRHWRAQETILLNLMTKAGSIADSIAIQQQLSQIQLEIEQISGRLNYLKDQTAFSSLQVTVTEPGGPLYQRDPWGYKAAVAQAAHAFVDTVNGLIVLSGYLSPLLVVGGLAGLAWLGLRRRFATA